MENTKDKNIKTTKEYPFKRLQKKVNYIAKDIHGEVYGFKNKPIIYSKIGLWTNDKQHIGEEIFRIQRGKPKNYKNLHWTESLIKVLRDE